MRGARTRDVGRVLVAMVWLVLPLGSSGCGARHTSITIHPEHVPTTNEGACTASIRIAPFEGPPPGLLAELQSVDYDGEPVKAVIGYDALYTDVHVEDPPALILSQALRVEFEARGCGVRIVGRSYAPQPGEIFVTGRYIETVGQSIAGDGVGTSTGSYVEMRVSWSTSMDRAGHDPVRREFAEVGRLERPADGGLAVYEEAMEASIAASVERAADAILALSAATGSTTPGCTDDHACKAGRVCVAGTCADAGPGTRCEVDRDCPGEMICDQRRCTKP